MACLKYIGVLILLCCSSVSAHDSIDPFCWQNYERIKELDDDLERKAALGWTKNNSLQLREVQKAQARTMALLMAAEAVTGVIVVVLSGVIGYVFWPWRRRK